jgi:hypothetical protein
VGKATTIHGQADEALTGPGQSLGELLASSQVKQYRSLIGWHCSAECGGPIRLGDLYVQTSPGLRPLTRAHVACAAGRKGIPGAPIADEAVAAALGRYAVTGPPSAVVAAGAREVVLA